MRALSLTSLKQSPPVVGEVCRLAGRHPFHTPHRLVSPVTVVRERAGERSAVQPQSSPRQRVAEGDSSAAIGDLVLLEREPHARVDEVERDSAQLGNEESTRG